MQQVLPLYPRAFSRAESPSPERLAAPDEKTVSACYCLIEKKRRTD